MSPPADVDPVEVLLEDVRAYLGRNLEPLAKRLKSVEEREPQKGDPGLQGEKGLQGEPGQKGDTGEAGARGEQGPAGERGEKGEPGDPGARGEPGEPGKDGEKGLAGDKGDPGERGESGLAGEAGEKGDRGDPGERGEQGEKGQDVDMEAVKALVLEVLPEIVSKAVQQLVDKQMAQARIEAREQLEKAIKGIPEPKQGEKGLPGEDGRDGRDGPPGRDAAQIEILSEIDPDTVYRRGTWATHQGGLWRSFEKTAGMKGWECIVDGFQGAEIDYGEDVRTATVKLLSSSGVLTEKTFQLPSLVHRGVWKQQTYGAGDTVMKDGHLWIALAPADEADEPGTSKAWQLAVRRGRDGRDDLRAAALKPVLLS
jgi:hypothetical protein